MVKGSRSRGKGRYDPTKFSERNWLARKRAEADAKKERRKRQIRAKRQSMNQEEMRESQKEDAVRKRSERAEEANLAEKRRLKDMKMRVAARRADEGDSVKKERLLNKKAREANRRADESDSVKKRRLLNKKAREADRRAQETSTARKRRLEEQGKRDVSRRVADDTPAKRRKVSEAESKKRKRSTDDSGAKRQRRRERSHRRSVSALREQIEPEDAVLLQDSGLEAAQLADPNFFDDVGNQFQMLQWSHEWYECSQCCERFPDLKVTDGWCTRCKRKRDKGNKKRSLDEGQAAAQSGEERRSTEASKPENKFTALNNMDPGEVPDELKGLTRVEQLLIARIIVIMCVFKLPLGQNGYSGNLINIPQHVEQIANELPRDLNDTSILVLRKEGAAGSFKDFRVRREIVKALLWLKTNNPYYNDIEISEHRLIQLPFDGCVEPQAVISADAHLASAEIRTPTSVASSKSSASVPQEREPDCAIEATFVPNVDSVLTEEEMKAQRAQELLATKENPARVPWPARDYESPINEFKTLGYICQAFPTLFPYGKAGLREDRLSKFPLPSTSSI